MEAARRALSRGIYEGSGALAGLRNQNQNHGVVDQSVRSESEHNHNHNRTRTRARAIRTRARAIRTGVKIRIMALQKPICEQNTVPRTQEQVIAAEIQRVVDGEEVVSEGSG